jgi:integrase
VEIMSEGPERIRVGERVTIYPRGKKKVWVADFWRDGRHCRQSLRTANKKVAWQRALKVESDLAAGTYRLPPPATAVRQATEEYLTHLGTDGRAHKTLAKYRGVLALLTVVLAEQGVTKLQQFTAAHFDRFRTARKQAGRHRKTLYTEGVVVKQFFKWCRTRRLIAENPIEHVKLGKPRLEPKGGPGLAQVDQVLRALDEPNRTMVATLAFTGMRDGELQRLKPEDLDLAGGWLHVRSREGAETKTRLSRKVPVHPRLRPLLAALPKRPRAGLFTDCGGAGRAADGPVSVRRLNDRFKRTLEPLGIPAGRKADGFVLHSLRHFFETFCVNARVPQRVVDTWLGHRADHSMAAHYYRLPDEESRRFMEEVPFGAGEPAADAGGKE